MQRWTNGADGTFVARTTSGAAYGYGSVPDVTGLGKWAAHNGEYCGRIGARTRPLDARCTCRRNFENASGATLKTALVR